MLDHVGRVYVLPGGGALTAVDDVTLTINAGEVVALMGPSGSGKSTLLHLIGAIDRADRGHVTVDGSDLTQASRKELTAYRRRVGFVFQRYNLLPALTAQDNVLAPVLPYRVSFDKPARARQLLAAVGLEGREASLPSRMSGGQQQRVAIARALVNDPKLILADEPTGNLDSHTGAEIISLLLDLNRQHGTTLIVGTHDPQVAARCHRIIRLHDGNVVEDHLVPNPAGP